VPALAEGGTALKPGWSMVGEEGPELRYLPKGASVVPLGHSAAAGAYENDNNQQNNGATVINNYYTTYSFGGPLIGDEPTFKICP
jgi:hypothetical protein